MDVPKLHDSIERILRLLSSDFRPHLTHSHMISALMDGGLPQQILVMYAKHVKNQPELKSPYRVWKWYSFPVQIALKLTSKPFWRLILHE